MNKEYYIVYRHKNKINGKVYIGITKHYKYPYRRWGTNGSHYTHCVLFYKAILKYGWDNFEHIILCKTSKEIAIIMEKALIHYYKSLGISYNIAEGGEGAESFSPETKKKLSRKIPWIKGKYHTTESREKISIAGRRPCLLLTKLKISASHIGKPMNFSLLVLDNISSNTRKRFSKPVLQYDRDNNFIKEYPSTADAERTLGFKGRHISCCCRGARKTAYGYIWKYK